jgi:hypothetical protein
MDKCLVHSLCGSSVPYVAHCRPDAMLHRIIANKHSLHLPGGEVQGSDRPADAAE